MRFGYVSVDERARVDAAQIWDGDWVCEICMRGSARWPWRPGDDRASYVRGKLAAPSLPLFGLDRWGRCLAGVVYTDLGTTLNKPPRINAARLGNEGDRPRGFHRSFVHT